MLFYSWTPYCFKEGENADNSSKCAVFYGVLLLLFFFFLNQIHDLAIYEEKNWVKAEQDGIGGFVPKNYISLKKVE